VADCYDTMTSARSYKRPMSPEVARAELAACAGAQFDPHVVRAFLDISIGTFAGRRTPGLVGLGALCRQHSRLGQAVSAFGRVGAASVVVAGAVTAGTVQSAAQATASPHVRHIALSTGSVKQAAGGEGTENGAGGASAGQATPLAGSTNTARATGSTETTVARPNESGNGGVSARVPRPQQQ